MELLISLSPGQQDGIVYSTLAVLCKTLAVHMLYTLQYPCFTLQYHVPLLYVLCKAPTWSWCSDFPHVAHPSRSSCTSVCHAIRWWSPSPSPSPKQHRYMYLNAAFCKSVIALSYFLKNIFNMVSACANNYLPTATQNSMISGPTLRKDCRQIKAVDKQERK